MGELGSSGGVPLNGASPGRCIHATPPPPPPPPTSGDRGSNQQLLTAVTLSVAGTDWMEVFSFFARLTVVLKM